MHAFMTPLAIAGFALAAVPLAAQLPSASPAALAMGDNYTAMARGFAAVSWNPANLGLDGNPTFSLTIFGIRAASDLGPITLGDISKYGGQTLPEDAKAGWMERVEAGRGELGDLGAGITYFGLSAGRFAVQLSSSATGTINLAPGAVELALCSTETPAAPARRVTSRSPIRALRPRRRRRPPSPSRSLSTSRSAGSRWASPASTSSGTLSCMARIAARRSAAIRSRSTSAFPSSSPTAAPPARRIGARASASISARPGTVGP